jgi:MOSC domain-containing protein YiiM
MARLIAIARAPYRRAALVELPEAQVSLTRGIEGDARGATPGRQVTALFKEGWDAACRDLGVELPWVTRRANLLIEGLDVPRAGVRFAVGGAVLEVTAECDPCRVMEAAHRGLRSALTPDWRGGVCCKVRQAGTIRAGDAVRVL